MTEIHRILVLGTQVVFKHRKICWYAQGYLS